MEALPNTENTLLKRTPTLASIPLLHRHTNLNSNLAEKVPRDDSYVPIPFIDDDSGHSVKYTRRSLLQMGWAVLKLVVQSWIRVPIGMSMPSLSTKSGNLVHENNSAGLADKIMKITDANESVLAGLA